MGVPGFLVFCALWCVTFSANIPNQAPAVPSYNYGVTGEPDKVDTAFGNLGNAGPMYEIEARGGNITSSSPSPQNTADMEWLSNLTSSAPTTINTESSTKGPKSENVSSISPLQIYNVTSGEKLEPSDEETEQGVSSQSQNQTVAQKPGTPGKEPESANTTNTSPQGLSTGAVTSTPGSTSHAAEIRPSQTTPAPQTIQTTKPSLVSTIKETTTTTARPSTTNETKPSQVFEVGTSDGEVFPPTSKPIQQISSKPTTSATPSQTFETGVPTTTGHPASSSPKPSSSMSFRPSHPMSYLIASILIAASTVL